MADRVFTYNINYEPEAISLFSRMSSQPDARRKAIINETIFQLKFYGIWSELDAIYFIAAADSQVAKLNWKSSSFNLSELGTMNFVVDRGFTRNGVAGGTTDALTTNFTPSTDGVKFTLNSNSFGVYTRTNIFEAQGDFGALMSGNLGIQINVWSSATQGAARNNQTGALVFNTNSSLGLSSIIRTSSTLYSFYKNGVFNSSLGGAATGSVAVPLYICALNVQGSGINYGATKQNAFAYMGSGNINQANLYNIIQFYMNSIGAAV